MKTQNGEKRNLRWRANEERILIERIKSKDVTNLIYQQYRIKYIWMSFQFPSPRSHLPFPRVCSTRDPKQKSMCLLKNKKPKGQIERFFGVTRKEREGLLSWSWFLGKITDCSCCSSLVTSPGMCVCMCVSSKPSWFAFSNGAEI